MNHVLQLINGFHIFKLCDWLAIQYVLEYERFKARQPAESLSGGGSQEVSSMPHRLSIWLRSLGLPVFLDVLDIFSVVIQKIYIQIQIHKEIQFIKLCGRYNDNLTYFFDHTQAIGKNYSLLQIQLKKDVMFPHFRPRVGRAVAQPLRMVELHPYSCVRLQITQ